MKKIIRIVLLLFILLIFVTIKNKVKASTSATVYSGEAISIEKSNDVDVVSNDVNIDLTTSKVTNTFILKNLKNSNLITKITAKLEDEKTSFSIKDLSIKVNNLEIKNIEKNKDNYIFKIEIPSEGYKKIEINYTTENDLKNAKILRYNIEKLKGKNIKKFNINFKIPEEDIPLVKKIYPECFEFDEDSQTINVKYYDFTVNNLTKDFIIQKETWKNLLYGEDSTKGEIEEAVLKKARDYIKNGVTIDYNKYIDEKMLYGDFNGYFFNHNSKSFLKDMFEVEWTPDKKENSAFYRFQSDTYNSILSYILYKQVKKDNIYNINDTPIVDYNEPYNIESYSLVKDLIDKYYRENNLYGKKVCIDYVESEGDKKLYTYNTNWYMLAYEKDLIQLSELDILKQYYAYEYGIYNAPTYREIHVGIDIDGNRVESSEKERIEYANMLGVDLYLRKIIYDVNSSDSELKTDESVSMKEDEKYEEYKYLDLDGVYAYYTDNNKEIADAYFSPKIKSAKTRILKFENETISKYSRVPTLTESVGYRLTRYGKYVVNYFKHNFYDCRDNLNKAIETTSAKNILNENNKNNEEKANNIDNEIKNIAIETDYKEYEDKKEIITSKAEEILPKALKDKINLNIYELIFAGGLALAIIINIIIIMRKRGKKNGK